MTWVMRLSCLLACVVAVGNQPAAAADVNLQRGIPADVYLAVHTTHNPERDYQRAYYEEAWKTMRETQVLERAVKIIAARVPAGDRDQAQAFYQELQDAVRNVDLEAFSQAKEVAYAQRMETVAAQHLVLIRLTPAAAASSIKACEQLFQLFEKRSGGEVKLGHGQEGAVPLTILTVPPQVPYQLTVAQWDDVLLFSTSENLARQSLRGLQGSGGASKFDDERLKKALQQLPAPEDAVVIYDGRLQFEQLRSMFTFIAQQAANAPDAQRFLGLARKIIDELAVIDYLVTVEFTDGYRNCSTMRGSLVPGSEDRLLTRMTGKGKPWTDWQTWVPADATSYSLSQGVHLLPLYEYMENMIRAELPEAEEGWKQFEQWQDGVGISLKADILQAFSGESVSIGLPAKTPSVFGGQDSFLAMRCHNPEKIRELLHRLVDELNKNPAIRAQQLQLKPSTELAEFEELSAPLFALFGVRPVIGFHDGWMMVASNVGAAQHVLASRSGAMQTIVDTEGFQRFQLEVTGPVESIRYTDLAASTRQAAMMLNQVGLIAPVVIGLAGAQANPEELKPVQELLALLPDVARIVGQFDFLEAKLTVVEGGREPGTWWERSVTLVRPPVAETKSAPAEAIK